MAKTPEQKLAELEASKTRIQNRIAAEKAKLRKKERREDTRRKIIVGSVVLAHAEHDETFRDLLETILKNRTIRDADRELLGFPPIGKEEE